MMKQAHSATYHLTKSAFTVLLVAFLAYFSVGCQQLETLEMKQLALQARVDNNTEKLETILDQFDNREQALMAAMGSIQEEQSLQVQAVHDRQWELDKVIASLQATQASLKAYVNDLSAQYDGQQAQVVASLNTMTESQLTLQGNVTDLMDTTDTLQANLVALASDQTTLATVYDEDRLDLATIMAQQQTAVGQLQQVAETLTEQTQQSAMHAQQLQDLTEKVSQQDAEWANTFEPIQENTQQVGAILATLRDSRSLVETAMLEQKDQLSQALGDLQGRYTQWQERIASMQEEIKLLRSDTLSLDERMNQFQAVARKD